MKFDTIFVDRKDLPAPGIPCMNSTGNVLSIPQAVKTFSAKIHYPVPGTLSFASLLYVSWGKTDGRRIFLILSREFDFS